MNPSSFSDTGRADLEQRLRELYAARASGDLSRLCRLFAVDAVFKISGSSDGKAISIVAHGAEEIRSWLGVLMKTFRITHHEIVSTVIDSPRASVQWRASIHSRITGTNVATELVDMIEFCDGHIGSYFELLVPA